MTNPLLLPEIRGLLSEYDREELSALLELHPASVAEFSEGLTVEETWKFLELASPEQEAAIFAFYSPATQVELATGQKKERLSRLIEAMPHDDRVRLLRELGAEVTDELLPLVAQADREDIRRLLACPPQTAGAVMTTAYVTVPADCSVADAIASLRLQSAGAETIYYIYIVDAERRLIGFVSLQDLILAKPTAKVAEVMRTDLVTVNVAENREAVARKLAKFDFLAIPVTDDAGRLVGIVTHDDVLDVIVEAQTEDVQRMAGVVPLNERYLDAPFIEVWRKRSLWLSALFFAELFTFSALAAFEDAIQAVLALSLFVPLCISTGGNSGSQAATLITRAMALGEVSLRDWRRVILHELWMGIALGLTLGAIGFVRAALTPHSVLGNADRWMLALVIAQSVAAICLWGTLVGSLLPLVFKRIGADPAYASSPFVATFVDVTGVVIYFSIAKIYLL